MNSWVSSRLRIWRPRPGTQNSLERFSGKSPSQPEFPWSFRHGAERLYLAAPSSPPCSRRLAALWGRTEFQVNLKLGLTSQSPILEVFYEVYNELGFGFLESVYEKAMAIALGAAGLWVNR